MEYKSEKKLDNIENEIKLLKSIVLSGYGNEIKKPVSFRGLAKTKFTTKDVDKAIEKSRKSLFHHEEI